MKIELLDLTVRELVEDYDDDEEGGVTGYGGKLNIRPPFQREFIYKEKERNAVIDSMLKRDSPLNVMYWSDRENGELKSLTDSRAQSPLLSMWKAISLLICLFLKQRTYETILAPPRNVGRRIRKP